MDIFCLLYHHRALVQFLQFELIYSQYTSYIRTRRSAIARARGALGGAASARAIAARRPRASSRRARARDLRAHFLHRARVRSSIASAHRARHTRASHPHRARARRARAMLARPTSPGLVPCARARSGDEASASRQKICHALNEGARSRVVARATRAGARELPRGGVSPAHASRGTMRGNSVVAEAFNKDKLGQMSEWTDWSRWTDSSSEEDARERARAAIQPKAIMESRETGSSMDDSEDDASYDSAGVDALEAQVAKIMLAVERFTSGGRSSDPMMMPTAEELAALESSLLDDDEANASLDIPESEKLFSSKSTKKTSTAMSRRAGASAASSKTSRRASESALVCDEDSAVAEVASGVVTNGLAARSARARAVARGVRSRPAKTSVSQMVQTQSKERVRGVELEPRKVQKQSMLRVGNKRPATDSMRSYLKDIGSVTLLNADQEVELAKRIQDLMQLESIRENLVEETGPGVELSEQQWAAAAGLNVQALRQRLRDGKAAKNEMIQANLRLVVSIAKKYANTNMSFQDLIQEGCVGLIRGAEKFDFQRGYKFSTYAHWWIRQAVTRSISDQSRTIRLPVHLFEIISRISKMEQKFALYNGRPPTLEEVSAEMDMSVEKIAQIKKAAQAPVSLAQTMGGENKGRTVEDTLIDVNAEGPEKVSGKSLLKEDLENVLNTLNPRERDVLRLRYGLDDGRVKTLEEIGTVFSVTRERIRQIEAKALRKLKQPSRNSILQEYFDEPISNSRGSSSSV